MTPPHITIIGAGLAGLAAACDLHRAGWPTTVLEARLRVGGRAYTFRDGFADGQYAEAGGEFIEDIHERMLALTREFGLALDPVRGMGEWTRRLALAGKHGEADDVALWGLDLAVEIERVWQALAMLGTAVPDPTRPLTAPRAAELDRQSAGDWLNGLDVHPFAKTVITTRLRSEYLAEPEQLSLLELARWGALYYSDPEDEGESFRVRGGVDQIPQRMAAELPDVRLGAVVTAVQQTAAGASATFHQNGQTHTLPTAYVVLAVPPGPARQIVFDPPLPASHQAMFSNLHCGPVTKVMIQYRRRFWEDVNWRGSLLTDRSITCTWQPTITQPGESGILTVYTGAKAGADFSAMGERERIETAVTQLDQLFPGSAALVSHTRTMAWLNEPFSQGGYTLFKPGDVMAHWRALREPAGRVYVAGEHTAVHQGYMEGAVESGQRVAKQIQEQGA
ncbi:MAG: FAD-dependent oxidoreductase [Chloroflexi bacterium]|nr:FAD-dependent oxidoreductase [Ardenticatenaceae bacterium]MBL1130089.1 FAD-dependent oxidoreductase [Chloroflexota bacterium]NOG36175.1 FAD-dependent oxidoreductase [Chloroflexota bacterium]GIK54874.1 MAG: putative flavin-containing monoamine oxidase AofH [Chloroflexota bacterium]